MTDTECLTYNCAVARVVQVPADVAGPRVLDMHVHYWSQGSPDDLGTLGDLHGVPRRLPAAALVDAARSAGVTEVVQVTPSWIDAAADPSADQALETSGVRGVFCRVDPRAPNAPEQLRRNSERAAIVGVRLAFAYPPATGWLGEPFVEALWRTAAEIGLPAAIYAPGRIDAIASIAREYPDLVLLVDHLAMGRGFTPSDDGHWHALGRLAEHPHVYLKASFMPETEAAPEAFVQPLRHLYERFGSERICWGSNFPIVLETCSYDRAVTFARTAFAFLTTEEAEAVFYGTADRLLSRQTDDRSSASPERGER